jgi:hypothetical protein
VDNSNHTRSAFYAEVQANPLLLVSEVSAFNASPSRCSSISGFVEVSATYRFRFLTPGLYSLLSLNTGTGWTLQAVGVGRCEVVR